MRKILVGTLLLLIPCGAEAQARAVRDAGLPASVQARLQDLLDAPDTRVRSGPGSLDASEHLTGALFVEGGPFTVAGRVEGDVVMVGGELILDARARVDGEVVVVNGSLSGEVGRLTAVSLYGARRATRARGAMSAAGTRATLTTSATWRWTCAAAAVSRAAARTRRRRSAGTNGTGTSWETWTSRSGSTSPTTGWRACPCCSVP